MSKRVLIISYYWPPTGGSGVQRWVKFSRYLPSEGWQPVVYTPLNPEMITVDESLAKEIPAEVEVIKTRIFEPYEIYRKLTGKKGGAQKGEVNPINAGKKSFGQRVAMFIRGNFFVPDPRCFWIGPSVKYLKNYLKEHPVDMIVSTGPPHSMHLIARKVALSTGIPWIADFRDPWTKMFYFKHLGLTKFSEKRHAKLEKQVLDDATVVVAVSPLVRDEFVKMTKTPVELITNGFDENDAVVAKPDGNFNLTHTGLFASDGIPETLWEVLSEKAAADEEFASKLRIRLVGKTDAAVLGSLDAAGLEKNVVHLGYQPHHVAVEEQVNATILILPLRKEPEYRAVLPGKLFEYLSARRPILGIGQPDGAMATIVADTNTGETYNWDDKGALKAYIDRHWDAFKRGDSLYEGKDVSAYSRRALTRRMAELMNRLKHE